MARTPLVDADVDLRDFPFMPIDITRLFGSEFNALSDDTTWRAGVSLWLKSYHQVPAASISGNDMALARLCEVGPETWAKIKRGALRGWIKCRDGRYYHPVVAEKALEGWIEKLAQRKASAAGNAKRHGYPFDPAPFDGPIERAKERLAALNPRSRTLAKRHAKYQTIPPGSQPAPAGSPGGSPFGAPDDIPVGSQETGKGREEITLREESLSPPSSAHALEPDASGERNSIFDRFRAAYPLKIEAGGVKRELAAILDAGKVSAETVIAGAERYAKSVAGKAERFICSPVNWLKNERWTDGEGLNGHKALVKSGVFGVFVKQDTPQWDAWRLSKGGKAMPTNRDGGWYFPTEWPPERAPGSVQ